MLINIKNLGAITEGKIDTSYPFILMCGPNSTGKTYLSYLIHAIYSNNIIDLDHISQLNIDFESIKTSLQFDIRKEYVDKVLEYYSTHIYKTLGTIYGLSDAEVSTRFKDLHISLSLSDEEFNRIATNARFRYTISISEDRFRIIKDPGNKTVKIQPVAKTTGEETRIPSLSNKYLKWIIGSVARRIAKDNISSSEMQTVERNSIYTFTKELSLTRINEIDQIIEESDHEETTPRIQSDRRYPAAIRESIIEAADLDNTRKYVSGFYNLANQIEFELLHGKVSINETGIAELQLSNDVSLPIQTTSSIVKTLASVVIYLKHRASENDVLIIDEPEMNLHPDNQILLARILVRLYKRGLRLIVSTHSDYIIREINNMVMASELASQDRLDEDLKIIYDEGTRLDRKDLSLAYFNITTDNQVYITNPEITETGFDVESIDNTILAQNDLTNRLSDTLLYE